MHALDFQTLLPFEITALQRPLGSKIEAKFCNFDPLYVQNVSEFYLFGVGSNL